MVKASDNGHANRSRAKPQAQEGAPRKPVRARRSKTYGTWIKAQADNPVSRIEWVDPSTLFANDYNPNRVAPVEMRLLKVSLMEDGWTQPIVARQSGEIVDGFHRWNLALTDPEVAALGEGQVPVCRLDASRSPADQRMATIRHNRARGSHYVVKMADIVTDLATTHGLTDAEIGKRLEMDPEEIERLRDYGNMRARGSNENFGQAWTPSWEGDPEDEGADADA